MSRMVLGVVLGISFVLAAGGQGCVSHGGALHSTGDHA